MTCHDGCNSTVHWLQKKDNPPAAGFLLDPLYLYLYWAPSRWESGSKSAYGWIGTLEWTAVYEALSTYKPLPGTLEAIHSARGAQPADVVPAGFQAPARQCPPFAPGTKKQTPNSTAGDPPVLLYLLTYTVHPYHHSQNYLWLSTYPSYRAATIQRHQITQH